MITRHKSKCKKFQHINFSTAFFCEEKNSSTNKSTWMSQKCLYDAFTANKTRNLTSTLYANMLHILIPKNKSLTVEH